MVKGAVKIIARLTYRERYEKSTGQDPLICAHCRGEMGLWRIWHPIYGVVYDEGERIKRSRTRHMITKPPEMPHNVLSMDPEEGCDVLTESARRAL